MKKIGIHADALNIKKRTGTERYLFELLRAMAAQDQKEGVEIILYVSKIPDINFVLPDNWSWKVLSWPFGKLWTHIRLSIELFINPPEILFIPVHEVPIFTRKSKIIFTVHDLAFHVMKDLYSWKNRFMQEWSIKRAIKKSEKLIAVSKMTNQDLMDLYSVPEKKIEMIHEGFDMNGKEIAHSHDILQKYRLSAGNYFVTIGRIEKKKNSLFLLKSFEAFKQKRGIGDPHQLVFIGSLGFGGDEFLNHLKQSPYKDQIHILGYLPDKEMFAILQDSLCFVFPSQYEGFGLPILEAFSLHVPVIASDLPVFKEIGGEAIRYFSTSRQSDLVKVMEEIILSKEKRGAMAKKGIQQVEKFTWKKAAKKTWDLLHSLI